MIPAPTLGTSRLSLRAHARDDFDAYARLWAEAAVVRHLGGVPLSREAAWSRFLRQAGHWHHLGFGPFALEDRATGAFVGEAGFLELRRAVEPSIEGTIEAGWVLGRAWQGRGLAEEAMRAALAWAERSVVGSRFTCIIHPDNAASLRVAGKLGFGSPRPALYDGRPMVLLERPRVAPVVAPGSTIT